MTHTHINKHMHTNTHACTHTHIHRHTQTLNTDKHARKHNFENSKKMKDLQVTKRHTHQKHTCQSMPLQL